MRTRRVVSAFGQAAADIVLETRLDPGFPESFEFCKAKRGDEFGIFAEAFLAPAPARIERNVENRRVHAVDAA